MRMDKSRKAYDVSFRFRSSQLYFKAMYIDHV